MQRSISAFARILALGGLALACVPAPGGAAEPGRAAPPGANVRFQRLTIDDGLAQSSVLAVLQDRQGYMWMATEDGLHRYDGYSFTIFRNDPNDADSLSENHIYSLLEDRDGGLWIGTYNGGLNRYDPATGKFTRYGAAPDDPRALTHPIVFSLAEDRVGRIWVGTDNGLNRLDRASGEIVQYRVGAPGTDGLPHNRIWALHVDAAGRVWLGTHAGLALYDPATGRFTSLAAAGAKVSLAGSINVVAGDAAGRTWVGSENGVSVFDQDVKRVAEYSARDKGGPLPSSRVRAVRPNDAGEVWLGMHGGGLVQLNPASGRIEQFRHDPADINSLSDDAVVALFEDRGGVLWVGTETQGINRFNPATRRFQHWRHQQGDPRSLPHRMVWSMLEGRDGALWVGTEGGLARIDRTTGAHRVWLPDRDAPQALASGYVPALHEDAAGTLWAGTDRGLHRVRPDGRVERVRFEGEGGDDSQYINSVTSIVPGEGGRLWLGTPAGLLDYDPRRGLTRRIRGAPVDAAGLPAEYVLTLCRGRDGALWVGTEHGLARVEPASGRVEQTWRHVPGQPSLAHNTVQALVEDADGVLWIGTTRGLDRLDPKSGAIRHFGTAEGLPNNTVYGLVLAEDGALWLSTNRGIARLDRASDAVRSWTVDDGLQSNEFNGGAAHGGRSGWLYFGGINGLNAFRPGDLEDREFPPSVGITHVDLVDRSQPVDGKLASERRVVLGYTEPVITFQFAAFDYAAPNRNRFRFQLVGFDADWREGGTRNHVTYTNLDPGSYQFRVRGANAHGTWSEQESTFDVVVLPPPWRTWWAYVLYALAVLVSIALIARAHHQKVTREHQLQAEQQKRRWSETLHQLSQSLASSLDAQQIAELLMDSLRRMLNFRSAALFVEQGVEVQLVGVRGLGEEQARTLKLFPEARARLFAEIRHRREPVALDVAELKGTPLAGDADAPMHYLAIPTFSRSEEFALLLVGRPDGPFTEQEQEIAGAVARQALVALDNARLFAELQNLATTDNLTKVNNRRYFFELAELEFARSRRYGRNLSVILLDADEFTAINEQYGHEVGDRVLRLIASTCRANLRHFDIIGRYGGEDFVILLPETPLNVAADVADRLRKAIEGLVIETHKDELHVSVSLGVAIADPEVADLATLINRADMALYEAKRSGRNRVVVAEQH